MQDCKIIECHTSPIPDDIFKTAYKEIKSPSAKVILTYIARKTLGYQKLWDEIASSQYCKDLGMSRSTVVSSLKLLEAEGWIEVVYFCSECRYKIGFQKPCPYCLHAEYPSKAYSLRMADEVVQFLYNKVFKGRMNIAQPWREYNTTSSKKVARYLDEQESSEEKTIQERFVASQVEEETKQTPLRNFQRYEQNGREKAVKLQKEYGVLPDKVLLDYWLKNDYAELIEHYTNQGIKSRKREVIKIPSTVKEAHGLYIAAG